MRCFNRFFALCALALLGGTALAVPADSLKENYQPIIDRNPFGLKPPPPPPTNNPAANNEPKPKVEIFLTGITSVGHPRVPKRAFFKTQQQAKPGAKNEPGFYELVEGNEKDGIKVIAIDEVEKKVKILMDNQETMLSFQTHGVPAPSAPPAGKPGAPGVPGGVPLPGQPGAPQLDAQGQPIPQPLQNQGIPQVSADADRPTINGTVSGNSGGLRQIPSRSVRVRQPEGSANYGGGSQPQSAVAQPQSAPVDPAEQYIRMHLNRAAQERQQGIPMPPLPTLPGHN